VPELPIFTYQDIMALHPCTDPVKNGWCGSDWSGTMLDVLTSPAAPNQALWLVLRRHEWLPEEVWLALEGYMVKRALPFVRNPSLRGDLAQEAYLFFVERQSPDPQVGRCYDKGPAELCTRVFLRHTARAVHLFVALQKSSARDCMIRARILNQTLWDVGESYSQAAYQEIAAVLRSFCRHYLCGSLALVTPTWEDLDADLT